MTLPKMEMYHVTGTSHRVALPHCINCVLPSSKLIFSRTPSSCTTFYYPNPMAGALYCIRPSLHVAACICDICCTISPPTPRGPFPCCEGVVWPLAIFFSFHSHLKNYMLSHLF